MEVTAKAEPQNLGHRLAYEDMREQARFFDAWAKVWDILDGNPHWDMSKLAGHMSHLANEKLVTLASAIERTTKLDTGHKVTETMLAASVEHERLRKTIVELLEPMALEMSKMPNLHSPTHAKIREWRDQIMQIAVAYKAL